MTHPVDGATPARVRRARTRAAGTDERGVAAVWMIIVLLLMLGIAAIAVDLVHALYVAQEAQSAADAASLAGVVYLPNDVAGAQNAAYQNATLNGFTNGVDNATVTAGLAPGSTTQLTVHIKKTFPTFFAKAIGFDTLTVNKTATAAYAPPVALGSPENSFGFQPYRGVWGAINGYCTSREDGDLRASRYFSNRPQSDSYNTACPEDGTGPATLSPDYDSSGYSYLVEMKQPAAGSVALQVFDGPYRAKSLFPGGGCTGPGLPVAPNNTPCPDSPSFSSVTPNITTTFEVWNLNNTPFDTTDDTLVATRVFGTSSNFADFNHWDTIANLSSGPAIYRVRVYTKSSEPNSIGSNGFALGARVGGSAGPTDPLPRCVNDPNEQDPANNVIYSAGCPHIYAEREMSLFANQADNTAKFYLAEISKAYAGRKLVITLFDPGEGGKTLQVLDPSGNAVTFDWQTVDDSEKDAGGNQVHPTWPHYGATGVNSIDISLNGSSYRLDTNHSSDYRLSDRRLEIYVDLPSNYNPTATDWWKLSYKFQSSGVTDRTTWGAKIIGSPIRLVQ